ncbi:hypothetical protein C8R44DRAFT_554682, partial [Mycena epipterygia]
FDVSGRSEILKLRGIIYGGQNHFTCRIVRPNQDVWFHDGITTGRSCLRDGTVDNFQPGGLYECRGKEVVAVVYA